MQPACGVPRAEMSFGCDGAGRVAGGIGAFVDWWPIKAFRPCGKGAAAGVRYRPRGQDINTVLFGKDR